MDYDRELVVGKLRRWERYLEAYRLPAWSEIPNIGLYMDQVIGLITQYLDYYPPEIKDEKIITPTTVNNYVRMKIMPEPVKKKYYRVHIAYLVMICTLKQTLSIAMVQRLIPMDITEDEVRTIYGRYVERHCFAAKSFIEQVREVGKPVFHPERVEDGSEMEVSDLIYAYAVMAGFSKLLTEKLIFLEGVTMDQVEAGTFANKPAGTAKKNED
ncbi:MAG: DUF1836 domain-containing protein [Clostridiales bacterium]|nr:DUF1836 domain-containing protein [Clostridiales bacterium]